MSTLIDLLRSPDPARDSAPTLGKRLSRTAFWALAGAGLARISGLAAAMLVARVLGRDQFGKFSVILSTVGMFGSFAAFGLGLMASKYVAEFRTSDPVRAGRIVTLSELFALATGLVMALALVILAPPLARQTLAGTEMATWLRLSAVSLVLTVIAGAQTGALSGLEAFRAIARINLLAGLANVVFWVAGSMWAGIVGTIWGTILSAAVACLLNYLTLIPLLRKFQIPFPVRAPFAEHAILWRFSLPATIGAVIVAPINWIGNVLLIHRPNGYAEVAIVSAAYQWRAAILFIPATVGTAFIPVLSSLIASGGWAAFRKTARYIVVLSLIAGLFTAIPILTWADLAMKGYGASFRSGAPVLRFTVLAAALFAANNQMSRVLATLGRAWTSAAFDLVWAAVFLIFAFVLVPRYAGVGFAVALLVSAALQSVAQCCYFTLCPPTSATTA